MPKRFFILHSAFDLLSWNWPPVARVDNVFGDRNPVCSCVGMENYFSNQIE
jgi:glycine dehydrogenase